MDNHAETSSQFHRASGRSGGEWLRPRRCCSLFGAVCACLLLAACSFMLPSAQSVFGRRLLENRQPLCLHRCESDGKGYGGGGGSDSGVGGDEDSDGGAPTRGALSSVAPCHVKLRAQAQRIAQLEEQVRLVCTSDAIAVFALLSPYLRALCASTLPSRTSRSFQLVNALQANYVN
eukprot:6184338-Pleurochrysis_carterae.AAC.1